MSVDLTKELLNEVADGVDPGDRLDAIRRATSGGRRRRLRWAAAGGAGLIAASVATALALTTGAASQRGDRDPAAPAPRSSTTPTATDPGSTAVAVYYVGDTPDGPRLFREVRQLTGDPLTGAVAAAVGRDVNGSPSDPLDPDYRVPWPASTTASASLDDEREVIEIQLGGDPEGSLRDRGRLSAVKASLAIEQLVRTAQGAVGERLPVRFLLHGEPTDQVLGVPTSEPLTAGSDLAVLAHVFLTNPSEGQQVDNDEPFVVKGSGNSFEGNVVTRIQRSEGTFVVDRKPALAGTFKDHLFPFVVTFDLTDVALGDYVVISRTDGPAGEDQPHEDDRRITIVD